MEKTVNKYHIRRKFLALEPRIVFDAALPAAIDAIDVSDSASVEPEQSNVDDLLNDKEISTETLNNRFELVVIESGIENADSLVSELKLYQQILWIDKADSGINAITNALKLSGGADAIHLITHGNEQGFTIGIDSITQNSADLLAAWQPYLNENADILLYGCSIAQTDSGIEMLEKIAEATKADIQASDDLTGSLNKGGDWQLEYQNGDIETTFALSEAAMLSFDGVLNAEPTVTISGLPNSSALIGENMQFTVSFDNSNASDSGFGPYVNLFMPHLGADGVYDSSTDTYTSDPDGISFVSATYLGQSVQSTVITLEDIDSSTAGLQFKHPVALDSNGDEVIITLSDSLGFKEGDKMVLLELPFGSFTPDQPTADIVVTASVNNLADTGVALPIIANSGLQFGNTAVNDFDTDPSIQDAVISSGNSAISTVAPQLFKVSTSYSGPEGETATGPNYARSYTLNVDVAAGQTLDNAVIEFTLPESLKYLSASTTGSGTIDAAPLQTTGSDSSDDIVRINYTSLSGSTSATFNFYVDEVDQNNNAVIDPLTGDDVSISLANNIKVTGSWDPIDTRDSDAPQSFISTAPSIIAKSIAIQKSSSIFTDVGNSGTTPGDILQYSLSFQVSDYFNAGNLKVTDILSDGQTFNASFVPQIDVTYQGTVQATIDITPAFYSLTTNADQSTSIVFDIEGLLASSAVSDNLLGGKFDGADLGQTTAVIKFQALVNDSYKNADTGQTTLNLKQGDSISNSVTIGADIQNNANIKIADEQDVSSTSRTISSGDVDLSVYSVNDNTGADLTKMKPGDEVTFRIKYDLTVGDFEDFKINSFLPLPIFDVGDPDSDDVGGHSWQKDTVSTGSPDTGKYSFGPDASAFFDTAPLVVSTDTTSNFLTFDFSDFSDVTNLGATLDVLFTITVSDDAFVDQLKLTTLANLVGKNTFENPTSDNDITQITLQQPEIKAIKKGVIATDKTASDIYSEQYASGTPSSKFHDAGDANAIPFDTSGGFVINSDNVESLNLDNDVSGLDAGDTARFVLVIENDGSSPSGAFDVKFKDQIPDGFVAPSGGINMKIVDGAGTIISYTRINGAATDSAALFGDGIELDDASASQGAVATYDATNGKNIIIITYDLEVADSAEIGVEVSSEAQLFNYAGSEGGQDHTAVDLKDSAKINIAGAVVDKTITATSQAFTTSNNVAIGEIITYTVEIKIPEGTASTATFIDSLERGLSFVEIDSITATSGISTDIAGGFNSVKSNATIEGIGSGDNNQARKLTLDFGEVINSNDSNNSAETITVVYKAIVANNSSANTNNVRDNSAKWTSSDDSALDSVAVKIQEPKINVQVTPSTSSIDADDTVTWTVTVSAASGGNRTTAFDVSFSETLPSSLNYVASSLTTVSGTAPNSLAENSGTINADWTSLNPSETFVFTFQTTIDNSVDLGDTLSVTPQLQWTSLSGSAQDIVGANLALDAERTGDNSDVGGNVNDYTSTTTANVTVEVIKPVLSIVETSDANNGNNVAPGEIVRYKMLVALPESNTDDVSITPNLPDGLQYINDGTTKIAFVSDGGVSSSTLSGSGLAVSGDENNINSISPTFILPAGSINDNGNASGADPVFSLGNIGNAENDSNKEYIVIEFNALVNNSTDVDNADSLQATAQLKKGSTVVATSDSLAIAVVEPDVDITKTVSNSNGSQVTYQVVIKNTGTSPAYDVSLADALDSNLQNLTSISVSSDANVAGILNNSNASGIDFSISKIPVGESVTVTFAADIIDKTTPISNDPASVTWTSIEGASSSLQGSSGGASGEANGERTSDNTAINDYSANDNAGLSLVSGSVFVDVNADGIKDAQASNLSGVQVGITHAGADGIFGNADDISLTTLTDANGNYSFSGVPEGEIKTSVLNNLPANSAASFDTQGSLTDNQVDSTIGQGANVLGVNFGIKDPNDAPSIVNLDASVTHTEDAGATVIDSNMQLNDPELDAFNNWNGSTVTIARQTTPNAQDIFEASGNLGALTTGADLTVGTTVIGTVTSNTNGTLLLTFNANATAALVNSAMQKIAYRINNDDPGSSIKLDITVNDKNNGIVQGSGTELSSTSTIVVNITSTNDAPTTSAVAKTINEDNNYTFDISDFAFSDVDEASTTPTAIRIDTLPSNGKLLLNGSPVAQGQVIIAAEIANLIFETADNENSNNYGDFTFSVQDSLSGFSAATNFVINVLPVNDAPSFVNTDGGNTYTENANAIVIDSDMQLNDPELDAFDNWNGATVTIERQTTADVKDIFEASGNLGALTTGADLIVDSTVIGKVTSNANGTLLLTFNANATSALVDSAMQKIAYSFNGENPLSNVQLDITVNDKNNGTIQGSGTELSSVKSVIVNIDSVNDAPTTSPNTKTIDEDSTYGFAIGDFSFSDVDEASTTPTAVRLDTLPSNGTITLNGTDVTLGQVVSAADISNLIFTPASNESAQNYGDFTFSVQDSLGAFSASTNFTIHVNPISDAPDITAPENVSADGITRSVVLDIDAALTDTDGSESLDGFLTLSDLATGLVIKKGDVVIEIINGVAKIPTSLSGDVTLNFGNGFSGSSTSFTVSATSQDGTVAPASSSKTINATLLPAPATLPPSTGSGTNPTQGNGNQGGSENNFNSFVSRDSTSQNIPLDSYNFGDVGQVRLYIAGNIDNRLVIENEPAIIEISKSIFKHVNPNEPLEYEVSLVDGGSLPEWLTFDEESFSFKGTPPIGSNGDVEIVITASDTQGGKAESGFSIIVNRDLAQLEERRQLIKFQDIMTASGGNQPEDSAESEDIFEINSSEKEAPANDNDENGDDGSKSEDANDDTSLIWSDPISFVDNAEKKAISSSYMSFSSQISSHESEWEKSKNLLESLLNVMQSKS